MSWLSRAWDERILPFAIERCCGQRSIARQREKVVPEARGRVLEVGVGSGLNLAFYDPSRVEEVLAIDPSPALLAKAQARVEEGAATKIRLQERTVDALDVPDGSFDTVVITYTLCSVPDPARALITLRRALAPGGRLVLSEHGLAPDAGPSGWQHRLNPVWSRLGGGCHLDRDVPKLLAETGFDVGALEQAYLPGPRWLNYHYWGVLPASDEGDR